MSNRIEQSTNENLIIETSPLPQLETAWKLPIQGMDVLKGMRSLLSENGILPNHRWERIALLGTVHTFRGLEYAASAVSLLPSCLEENQRSHVVESLAAFEIWRHGANIFDDFTDKELYRNEYRDLVEPRLTESELLILQNVFHFIGISKMTRMQTHHNKEQTVSGVPDIKVLFGKIYSGWRDKTEAMERKIVWDDKGDPLKSYWETHVAISTALFYQVPYTLIGLVVGDGEQQMAVSDIGYRVGELIHSKNDLQDLTIDIRSGDFSYPVLIALQEGIVTLNELQHDNMSPDESHMLVDRMTSMGLLDRFVDVVNGKSRVVKELIGKVQERGNDCTQINKLVDHLSQKIQETLDQYRSI